MGISGNFQTSQPAPCLATTLSGLLLLLALAEDLKQLNEEVDNVEIERCCCKDVLLR